MESLEAFGVRIEVIRVSPSGTVDFPEARELSRRRIRLVSCQWVNQESGMVLPISEIARECGEAGVPLHVDAVQACGRIAFGPLGRAISLLSLSGHKLGGPPGTGVLVVREDMELRPTLHGGGQERGLRPGTEDVAGAVGFARALEVCLDRMPEESLRIADLRARLEGGLLAALPETRVSAKDASRAPHILGLGIPGLPRDVLTGALDLEGIGASAGSACASGSTDVSPTFRALHGQEAARLAPLRLSLGWTSTSGEVEEAIRTIPRVVERVRDTVGSEARIGKDRTDSPVPMGETAGRTGRQPR
jgi:cysteine desulfurase